MAKGRGARALLVGAPVYTADLAPDDTLVVKLVRSRHANAYVTAIDASAALAMPGAVAVLGPDDLSHNRFTLAGQSFPEPSPYDTVLLERHVRYVGDEVAMVVAVDERTAAVAARAVRVSYEQLPAVLDMEEALDGPTIVHDEDDWAPGGDTSGDPARNLVAHGENVHGDLDAALADADVVTDYVAVVDCGTVINPALARVQAEGGIAQGIGMALTESVSRDEKGRLRTGSFMTYMLPTRRDVPEPRVEFMPSLEPTGPFGAKSIGEVVINTPSPAIMSAVAHATGRYVRELPITPSKLLAGE